MNINKTANAIEMFLSRYRFAAYLYAALYNTLIIPIALLQAVLFRHHLQWKRYTLKGSAISTDLKDLLYNSGMVSTYKKHLSSVSDRDGFIEYNSCDSLLFSSLLYGVGAPINIDLAEDKSTKGRWYRRSITHCNCYPNFSKSTISRDMLIGLMIGAFMQRRFDILLNLHRYGRKQLWLMGEGAISRIHLGSTLESTLATCLTSSKFTSKFNKLSKIEQFRIKLSLIKPVVHGKNLTKFHFHLQTLVILLRMLASGQASKQDLDGLFGGDGYHEYGGLAVYLQEVIRATVDYHTDLPKFQEFIQGRCNYVLAKISSDLRKYPVDRLPSGHDTGTKWIWEGNESLKPNNKDETYSGGDVLFLYGVAKAIYGASY